MHFLHYICNPLEEVKAVQNGDMETNDISNPYLDNTSLWGSYTVISTSFSLFVSDCLFPRWASTISFVLSILYQALLNCLTQ